MTVPEPYFEPTQESGAALFRRDLDGPIVMLNLLRFREQADYSATPDLAPPSPISGAEAYRRYVEFTKPFLHDSGGEVLFEGDGGHFFIGPPGAPWWPRGREVAPRYGGQTPPNAAWRCLTARATRRTAAPEERRGNISPSSVSR